MSTPSEEDRRKVLATLSLLAELSPGSKPGDRGKRPCPICSATLHFAFVPGRRGLNFRLACETDGCISAMS